MAGLDRQRAERRRRCCKHVAGDALRFFLLQHALPPPDRPGSDWRARHADPDGTGQREGRYETFVRFAERVQRVTGRAVRPTCRRRRRQPRVGHVRAAGVRASSYQQLPRATWTTTSTPAARSACCSSWSTAAEPLRRRRPDSRTRRPTTPTASRPSSPKVRRWSRRSPGILGLTFAPRVEGTSAATSQLVCRPDATAPRPAEQPRTEAKDAAKDNPLKKAAVRPDRPDPQAARRARRHPRRPPRRHDLASGMTGLTTETRAREAQIEGIGTVCLSYSSRRVLSVLCASCLCGY